MMRMRWGTLAVLVVCACGDGAGKPMPDARMEGFDSPDLVCPGGPTCASLGDGTLRVGAAKRVYTPQNFETYTDENEDRQWQTTEPYVDLNGNGKFDAVWLFGGARAALGVTTDVEVRAMAFIEGDVAVVIAWIDSIGMLSTDFDEIRKHPLVAPLDIDHVLLGTTHAHDTPDTMGLWGPSTGVSGRQDFVTKLVHDAAAEAIKEAYETAQPAHLVIAKTMLLNDPSDPMSLTDDFNKDIRDPVIMDPTLTIARFVRASNPSQTIGTLVNWGNHPEVSHFDDSVPAQISAHFPSYLRSAIEQGVADNESIYANGGLPGIGGVTMYVQGALGGQIGSLRGTHPPGPDGTQIIEQSDAKDRAIGVNAAARALIALRDNGETVSDLPLAVKSAKYHARIDNTLFHVGLLVGVFGDISLLRGYNTEEAIVDGNFPWIPARATFVQVGPLGLVTAPGELHPELWVGGYDGSWTWGWPLYDPNKPNGPRFDQAPPPPYMRDLVLAHDGVRYPIVAGSGESYLGYLVPSYNFDLHPVNPYIKEAEGDHYEETLSLGPLVEQHVIHPILELLRYRK
jgi:hypothetical protein